MQEEPVYGKRKKKFKPGLFFALSFLVLEPGSIRKSADLENGVKIALVELCQPFAAWTSGI